MELTSAKKLTCRSTLVSVLRRFRAIERLTLPQADRGVTTLNVLISAVNLGNYSASTFNAKP